VIQTGYDVIKAHHDEWKVEMEEGSGSEVIVRLPGREKNYSSSLNITTCTNSTFSTASKKKSIFAAGCIPKFRLIK